MSTRRRAADLDLIVETVIYLQTEGRRLARAEAQRVGVSPTQLNVLMLLGETGELSLSELSRRLAAQNSTVTGIVDRMVASGLVEREQSSTDRRVWTIKMTEKGKKIGRSASVAPWGVLHRALDSLDGTERDELVRLLKKVAAHVATQIGEV